MSKKGKIFQKLIARLFTAVFLFVVIASTVSPVLPVYAGDDVSGNEAEDEFDWETYLEDDDEKEALIHNLAEYYAALYVSYTDAIGNSWDDIQDVVDPNHNLTDASWGDKFTAIVDYVSPFCQTYVEEYAPNSSIAPSRPSTSHSNSHHNDTSFLSDLVQDMGNELGNIIPGTESVFTELPGKVKDQNGLLHYDFFPDNFYISKSAINPEFYVNALPTGFNTYPSFYMYCVHQQGITLECNPYCVAGALALDQGRLSGILPIYKFNNSSNVWSISILAAKKDGSYDWFYSNPNEYFRMYRYRKLVQNGSKDSFNTWLNGFGTNFEGNVDFSKKHYIIVYGDCFFIDNVGGHYYFWDSSQKILYDLGVYVKPTDNQNHFIPNNIDYNSQTPINVTVNNIQNSVDFDSYSQSVNNVLNQVTENMKITNQLIEELFQIIAQQNNNFVPDDGDDINDFIRDLQDRLQRSIDLNLTVPDITPDLSGIANAIGAIFNFLSSIISAIGNIVSTLLDGLFHLIVPTDEQWNEISIEFDSLTAPLSWIRGFFASGFRAISTCVFGSDVTGIQSEEIEIETASVDEVMLFESGSGPSEHSNSHHDISYDTDSGAPRIPVHFSNSDSEYFNGIEDAYIIDLAWYAPFKSVGDVIVIAFCWILFIWKLLHDLPGIINGVSGVIKN